MATFFWVVNFASVQLKLLWHLCSSRPFLSPSQYILLKQVLFLIYLPILSLSHVERVPKIFFLVLHYIFGEYTVKKDHFKFYKGGGAVLFPIHLTILSLSLS